MVINTTRVLKSEEVDLIRKVAVTLDHSFNILVNQNEEKKVIVVYDNCVHPYAVSAVQTLVTGIDEVYRENDPSFRGISVPQGFASNIEKNQLNNVNASLNQRKSQKQKTSPSDVSPGVDRPTEGEEAEETPGVFERPLSLKGQRHVFLYKCRYSQLKSIIDKNGCWGLRMASLEDKWPCLVVYCAKDRESWMNAFRKIQKLERADFLRKKVSDSLKSVDLKRLEELTQSYGQKWVLRSILIL